MRIAIAFALLLLAVVPGRAVELMSAPEARDAVLAGELVLVDIRTPEEWRESGIGDVAEPVSMHDSQFMANLSALMAGNPDKRVAFICRTGGRSGYLTSQLNQAGMTSIIDVSEGMMGSAAGPGWISRGLPLKQVP